jgi:hypothetical protein
MPRRKELKGVAAGVLGSFVSRYTEVDGYWALGMLYQHAEDHATNAVEIDLLRRRIVPEDSGLTALAAYCSSLLGKQLGHRGIPDNWVRDAKISVQFDVPLQGRYAPQQTWREGRPFEAIIEVTDDSGTVHSVSALGWCAPHDPKKESRSARTGGLKKN